MCDWRERSSGLVVHGPLIATLLVDLLGRDTNWRPMRSFAFKAVSPLYDISPFEISGRLEDGLAVKAHAEFA